MQVNIVYFGRLYMYVCAGDRRGVHFYNHALKKVGPGLKRGGGGAGISVVNFKTPRPLPLPWCYDANIWFVFCCIFFVLLLFFLLRKFSAYFGYYKTLAIHTILLFNESHQLWGACFPVLITIITNYQSKQ